MNFKERKQAIRAFLRNHYSTEQLYQQLDRARSGELTYTGCDCFIGFVTRDHARGQRAPACNNAIVHLMKARALPGALDAEFAYHDLWSNGPGMGPGGKLQLMFPVDVEDARRRRLIPMILAEIRFRNRRISIAIASQQEMEVVYG